MNFLNPVELHCHTIYSNSKTKKIKDSLTTVEKLLETGYMIGLKAIAITDHNWMKGSNKAKEMAAEFGLTIISAIELDTNGKGQILAYGIKSEIEPFRNAVDIINDVHKAGGLAIIPHPFDVLHAMENLEEVYKHVDGIEVSNYGGIRNNEAVEFADKHGITVRTAGSDAHTWRALGGIMNMFPESCRTEKDYLECLKQGNFKIRVRRSHAELMMWGAVNVLNGIIRGYLS